MKTTITYIAIFTFLLTHISVFSQEIDRENSNNRSNESNKVDKIETVIAQKNMQTQRITKESKKQAAAELINYQAVARDAGGNLITNTNVAIDFEIRDGAGGTAVYNETQNLTTDDNGVFSAQIGSVTPMAGINWLEIEPWLQVSMNGTDVGETQMGSAPTALHSMQSGAVMLYGSGSTNSDKMIVNHSPAFTNWGIGYNDIDDKVEFIAAGLKNASITLGSGKISTEGSVEVNLTTTSPNANTVYGNSLPIAFGKISENGGIDSGYGITSVEHEATGTYLITVDNPAGGTVSLVPMITPFTSPAATPEITGYQEVSSNSFRVAIRLQSSAALTDSVFSVVVFGN